MSLTVVIVTFKSNHLIYNLVKSIPKNFKVLIDRKRGSYYVGRTQYDSPDVDNEVLISADSSFLRVGEFVDVKIIDASDFDLYAEVN